MKFDVISFKSKLKKNSVHLFLLFVVAFVLATGILGVDFGYHWDEHIFINSVTYSVAYGTLLPTWYDYPSLCYNLALMALIPDVVRVVNLKSVDLMQKLKKLINISQSYTFRVRVRTLSLIVTSLSLFWIYLLVLVWRKNWLEALLSASLTGLSWEFAYHARFTAPDAIMMQFAALTMMSLFFAIDSIRARKWLVLSAIAAGLGCGTKYPGGLLLVPLLLSTFYISNKSSLKKFSLSDICKVLLIFILTYLITTPGTILQPLKFFSHVNKVMFEYGVSGHWGYTVKPGLEHLSLILNYLGLVVFSKYSAIAIIFFIMALMGFFSLVKYEREIAVIFLCFPFVYIAYMSSQKVMIVRNLLVLIPFFAILASRGFIFLVNKLKQRYFRTFLWIGILILLSINAFWLVKATASIRARNRVNYIEKLAVYIDRRPDTLFLLSETVFDKLLSFDKKTRYNITMDYSDKVKATIFYSSDAKDWENWIANRFNYAWLWFGPYEINFNYYPTWGPAWGCNDRIVVMPISNFKASGISIK